MIQFYINTTIAACKTAEHKCTLDETTFVNLGKQDHKDLRV